MAKSTAVPIRVAIIGLSASAVTSWAADAHLPSLLSPVGRENFKIAALCNSSVSAAEAAIKAFNLDRDVKAYGDPADLAADADIDFVIVCTRVDKHYETSLPSIKAGKDVFIEWPVTSSEKDTNALIEASKKSGSQVVIGLQGRLAPPILKIKELLEKQHVGKLLSTDIQAFGGSISRDTLPTGLKYFAQREVGGNHITIGVAHLIDMIQSVVGDVDAKSARPRFQLQFPENKLQDPETKQIVGTVHSNVPDLFALQGELPESPQTQKSATLTFLFRRGEPIPPVPSLAWTLNCEAGEIRLVAASSIFLNADAYKVPVTITVHHFGSGETESIEWSWTKEQEEIPVRGRSIYSVLQAYAKNKSQAKGATQGLVAIEDAAVRAAQIENWLDVGFKG